MNPECNSSDVDPSGDELSLLESRELLAEVRRAAEADPNSDLFQFAGLLCQLIDLHDSATSPLDGDEETAQFIGASLEEIRSVVGADQFTSERLETLRDQVIDRWGDQLTSVDEMDIEDAQSQDIDVWMQHDDCIADDDESDESDELVAPSAEAISSLLSQFGQTPAAGPDAGGPSQSDPPKPAFPDQQPPEQADRDTDAEVDACPVELSAAHAIEQLDPELREAFLDDASSCVSSMEDALLRLESDPSDSDSLNQICRELHTLKGASGSVGLSKLADQLHQLEDSLRDDLTAGRSPSIDSLLQSVDSIRCQISGSDQPSPQSTPAADSADVRAIDHPAEALAPPPLPQLSSFSEGPADDETVRVKSSQLNRLMDMLAELVMLRNRRETELSELQEIYHELIGTVSKMRLLSNEGSVESFATKSLQLSEIANDILEAAQDLRDCARPVSEGNTAVSQFIRQFRQELVELRRTPVSGLFRRLQRVVRDAAHSESKEVQLKLVGEDAGIERSLQQRLYEPLLHIVRNSVCHGIETPEQRSQSGKSPAGTITLEAKSGPDLFVIEIRDDGAGLDYDAIRRRGVERGLLVADQVASREELSQLIFQPGFSTRQTANQTAGRGVGMDVVASTLQRMRGWLEVDSEPKKGTRIRMSFPLPSVIQHAMVFRSAGQLFALPMQSVQTAGEVKSDSPCLVFGELLGGSEETPAQASQRIVLACDARGSANSNSAPVTLLVDEIVGPEEVVVRPLPSLLRQHPFCIGATLSGMGQTVLCLDARRVVESRIASRRRTEEVLAQASDDNSNSTRLRVLVVDDSLSARKRVVRSLRRYPLDIVEAADGKEALTILKQDRFVAVFSDMEMPHVSGMELLAEINSDGNTDRPLVVIISSRGEDEFTVRAHQLGAANYLVKPLADEALDGALRGIASLQHLLPKAQANLQRSGEIQ
jgi:chemosensory pili system protein ChpA (sensor histidine kinase/response regulator)